MQKHEVENATMMFGLGLPIASWLSGTYAGNIPVSPFPQALIDALHATPHDPFIMGGVVAGLGLAASAAYLLQEYGDDGFRGAPYRRWMRGSRMANWHSVKRQVNAANRLENQRRRKEEKGARDLAPIMIGRMPMPTHLENRNTLICASVGAGKSVAMESNDFVGREAAQQDGCDRPEWHRNEERARNDDVAPIRSNASAPTLQKANKSKSQKEP